MSDIVAPVQDTGTAPVQEEPVAILPKTMERDAMAQPEQFENDVKVEPNASDKNIDEFQ